jgi:uncharacterized protein YwqG
MNNAEEQFKLECYKLEKSRINILLNESNLNSKSSFVGSSRGYFPDNFDVPDDKKLVLQINFKDTFMHGCKELPKTGILQLWVSEAILYGEPLSLVVYHEDDSFPENDAIPYNKNNYICDRTYLISFDKVELQFPFASNEDFRRVESNLDKNIDGSEILDKLILNSETEKFKDNYILGHPYFIQEDPRGCEPIYDDDGEFIGECTYDVEVSLIQLSGAEIGFDDATLHLLIAEKDLINKDFTKAYLHHDFG